MALPVLPLAGAAMLLLLAGGKKKKKASTPAPVSTPPLGDTSLPPASTATPQVPAMREPPPSSQSLEDALAQAAAAAANAQQSKPATTATKPAPKPETPVQAPLAEPVSLPVMTPSEPMTQTTISQPSSPSPASTTPRKPLPAGYDPATARRSAKSVANHLRNKGRSGYDRRLLKAWQEDAGIAADGIYGGGTRGALLYYGATTAPSPFFKPTTTAPYTPPENR